MSSIFGKSPEETTVNFIAHPGQAEISEAVIKNQNSDAPASIFTLICGRGYGKTAYLVCEIVVPFMAENRNVKVMWVAPNYQTAMSPVDDVFKGTDERTGERFVPEFDKKGNRVWEFVTTRSGPQIRWHNGSTLYFRSADAPDSIVSKGFNLIVVDEAALIDQKIFEMQILGTARKAGIKIFLITTPRGTKHFTYHYYLKGQSGTEKNFLSFRHPYTKNPYYNKTQAELIKNIPDWMFKQEYLAEFVDDGNSVFKNIELILDGDQHNFTTDDQEWSKPIKDIQVNSIVGKSTINASDRRFVVGLDLAKSVDYTVLWGMCLDTGECVFYKRLNKTDYREILSLTADICKKLNNAELVFDATGVGSGLSDYFNNYDISTNPFHFTNESKNELINRLAVSIEHKDIKIPNIDDIKKEFNAFTYTITRTGKISYGAPSGFHDDIVIAAALANWYRVDNKASSVDIQAVEDIIDINNSYKKHRPGSFLDFMDDDND